MSLTFVEPNAGDAPLAAEFNQLVEERMNLARADILRAMGILSQPPKPRRGGYGRYDDEARPVYLSEVSNGLVDGGLNIGRYLLSNELGFRIPEFKRQRDDHIEIEIPMLGERITTTLLKALVDGAYVKGQLDDVLLTALHEAMTLGFLVARSKLAIPQIDALVEKMKESGDEPVPDALVTEFSNLLLKQSPDVAVLYIRQALAVLQLKIKTNDAWRKVCSHFRHALAVI